MHGDAMASLKVQEALSKQKEMSSKANLFGAVSGLLRAVRGSDWHLELVRLPYRHGGVQVFFTSRCLMEL